ncbi:MAG TPA: wax ester/triacylglycerol synthase family O-acyltransferase [Candidatus Limnocylindrales bacterium]|nr:wax ester/triacylglycerol synthase family O-acyltransferase [Candidatus Limnocylindrales bacterium]
MERLTGIDASFFYMETPAQHMHAVAVTILDPSETKGTSDLEAMRAELARRLVAMPAFRRRLAHFPLGLDHPAWIEAPVDVDRHVFRAALPSPGRRRQLEQFVGDFASVPLARDLPLWECCLLEGLEGGRLAMLVKVHHAIIDGVSGAQMLAQLCDFEPVVPVEKAIVQDCTNAEPEPSLIDLALTSLRARLVDPVRMGTAMLRTIRWGLQAVTSSKDDESVTLPLAAPSTPFSHALTPRRSAGFARASLEDVKKIKNAFGTTINDAVLAACTRALRRQLERRGCLPDRALVASVPVSARRPGEHAASYNRVSAIFVGLPVHIADPVEQLRCVHADASAAKRMMGSLGKDMLGQWMELAPPLLFAQAMRLYSAFRLADLHAPVHNVVISNVPGPPVPLYVAGARVEALYPLGPILEGAALNITVFSYRDALDIGVVTCPDLVDDVGAIGDDIAAAVAELAALADAEAYRAGTGAGLDVDLDHRTAA